jgi:hypothetical protein
MTKDEFWQIIQRSLDGSGGDTSRQADWLIDELEKLSPEEIISFEHSIIDCLLESYSMDLYGAVYIIAGGCSDNGFEYFRYWLISRGREWFEKAVQNPDDLADYPQSLSDSEVLFEEFINLAVKAYEKKTGQPFPHLETPPYEMKGEPWDYDEEVFRSRWPRLFAKYW